MPMIRMVIVAGFMAIMVFGGQMALDGNLNVGVYSVLVFMTQHPLWPLGVLMWTWTRCLHTLSQKPVEVMMIPCWEMIWHARLPCL